MAPVIRALYKRPEQFDSVVCVTAQHRQMLDQVLALFEIQPDYDLNLMQHSQTPSQVAASVLVQLEPILERENPDWVLVQGDTTTTMAAAVAAFYARVKVGHVEAGLRSFDKRQPFPEEINRIIAGVTADMHFAPTSQSRQNLLREGVPEDRIHVTGNPGIDAFQWVVSQPIDERGIKALIPDLATDVKLILVTAHRRENFGQPLEEICRALRALAERYAGEIHILYPVHLNPNVQEPVHRLLGGLPNVTLTPPLDYAPMAHLMQRATLVLTDSGGIQEEAPSIGKPVLVLREVTERPEALEAGTVRLVGTDYERIVAESMRLLEDPQAYNQMARAVNPYGDGRAAGRIAAALLGEAVEQF